ncbi:MAG TPA: hypothetical protein VN317_04620 [Candidatus Methanoperedens sp.]|nr:hypothetical protein [Candidatus Methanoperedens sp.]
MSTRTSSTIMAAVLTALLLAPPAAPPLAACDDEGPGLVTARIATTLSPDDAANIIVEKFNGTLVIKGIILRGTATWDDDGTVLAEGPVTVKAMILTTGDETTALGNRGILWLKYEFRDAVTGAVAGVGDGFATLERVSDLEGATSFQGSITIGGEERQFAGTGESEICGLLPPALTGPADLCADEESDGPAAPGLAQQLEDTVITGAKPGFEFESTRTPGQLNRQFQRSLRALTGERNERLRVLRAVR